MTELKTIENLKLIDVIEKINEVVDLLIDFLVLHQLA